MNHSKYLKLREQINDLDKYLNDIIVNSDDKEVLDIVEQIKILSRDAIRGSNAGEDSLFEYLASISDKQLVTVARIFSNYLNFTNIVELHQHVNKSIEVSEDDSNTRTSFYTLNELKEKGYSLDEVIEVINNLDISPILTPHPTEIVRRSMNEKYFSLDECLDRLDEVTTEDEKEKIENRIKELIGIIWFSDEVHNVNADTLGEITCAVNLVYDVLWQAVPVFYKDLAFNLKKFYAYELPLDANILKFSTIIGGEFCHNKNVDAQTSYRISCFLRFKAANLYYNDLQKLMTELIMRSAPEWLMQKYNHYKEPYRNIFIDLRKRLRITFDYFETLFQDKEIPPSLLAKKDDIIWNVRDLLNPLVDIYQALKESNLSELANGLIMDMIRRLNTFDISIFKLKSVGDAKFQASMLTDISEYNGKGCYLDFSDKEKLEFLNKILTDEIDLTSEFSVSAENIFFYDWFKFLAEDNTVFNEYLILHAKNSIHFLEVEALLYIFNKTHGIRVSLALETMNEFNNGPKLVEDVITNKAYAKKYKNQNINVFIGYNLGIQKLGLFTNNWLSYKVQKDLVQLGKKHNKKIKISHSRGGSIGRGGSATHMALLSLPAGSIKNGLSIIESGEMIRFKYGLPEIAVTTLDLYASGIIKNNLRPPHDDELWYPIMDKLSSVAMKTYKENVENPDFFKYYLQSTPNNELTKYLGIGKRLPNNFLVNDNVDNIKEIIWHISWMQNRLILSSWLGFATATRSILDGDNEEEKALLLKMVSKWKFLEAQIDLLEMIFSKVDFDLNKIYENRLVDKELYELGECLRTLGKNNIDVIMRLKHLVKKRGNKLMNSAWLSRSIHLRNIYTMPINLINIEVLLRLRNKEVNDDLIYALFITTSAMLSGMRNTS